jgi:threonine synthase
MLILLHVPTLCTNTHTCTTTSVDGSFDDCQAIVKGAFADAIFRDGVSLGAVNSINWARVLAQTTYYFWAYFRVTDVQVIVTLRTYIWTCNLHE